MKLDDIILQPIANQRPWLYRLKQQANAAIQEHGFPLRKTENWKYTQCKPILQTDYHTSQQKIAIEQPYLAQHQLTDDYCLVFVDGLYRDDLSTLSSQSGVTVCPMSAALINHEALIAQHLGKLANINTPGFTATNTALFEQGVFIHIADNCALHGSIQILSIASGNTCSNHHARHLVIVGENSQASVIEHYVSLDEQADYFNNIVTESFVAKNSQLHYYKLQLESSNAFHIHDHFIEQQAESQLEHVNIDIGSQLTRNWLQTNLQGEQANCLLRGLYYANQKQHIDNHTRIEHNVPNTQSDEYYKGIISDHARAVFNGQVLVAENAQKTDAQQQNRNLLLSAKAEIDTKPELQIHADDVKCAHGATIGQLDKTALFYLRSRGIDEATAKAMLTYGFAEEMLMRINNQTIRDYLEQPLSELA